MTLEPCRRRQVGAVSKVLRGKRQEYFKKCVVTRDMFKIIDEDGSPGIETVSCQPETHVVCVREALAQFSGVFCAVLLESRQPGWFWSHRPSGVP